MPHKHSSSLLAVLLIGLLAACNKTETPVTHPADELAKKIDAVAPASAPQPQVIQETAQVTDVVTAHSETGTQAPSMVEEIPIQDEVAVAEPPPAAALDPIKPRHRAIPKTAATVAQKRATATAHRAGVSPARQKGRADPGGDSAEAAMQSSAAASPAIAGKEKSQLCQGCHGDDGNSVETLIPKLAGQYGKYISKQIRDYQSGARTHQIMTAMAKTVSDSDLAEIAAYFASQIAMKGDGTGNPVGENLFINGNASKSMLACIKCHGVNGKGLTTNTSLFPVIGGQHKDYLRKQLMDFRGGLRKNSPGGIMNRITKSLTDAEIEALAEYVSAQ